MPIITTDEGKDKRTVTLPDTWLLTDSDPKQLEVACSVDIEESLGDWGDPWWDE